MSSAASGPGPRDTGESTPRQSETDVRPQNQWKESDKDAVLSREKEEHGGMKFGAGFFGWLAATGMLVLLTTLVGGAGTALGLQTGVAVPDPASEQAETVGLVGGIVLLVVLLVAYFCGGYVAGRMARFSGAKQGLAVWLWALIAAAVAVGIGFLAGQQFDVLARFNGMPQLPMNQGTLTTAGIVAIAAVLLVSLVGALLGGLVGMRYHRKIDRTGFGV